MLPEARELTSRAHKMRESCIKLRDLGWGVGSRHLPCTVRTYNAPKLRFTATVGEEPEVEVELV